MLLFVRLLVVIVAVVAVAVLVDDVVVFVAVVGSLFHRIVNNQSNGASYKLCNACNFVVFCCFGYFFVVC